MTKRDGEMLDEEVSDGRPISLVEFGRDLARRLAEYEAKYGRPFEIPRNSGTRRTTSKQALLETINAITDKQGWRW